MTSAVRRARIAALRQQLKTLKSRAQYRALVWGELHKLLNEQLRANARRTKKRPAPMTAPNLLGGPHVI